MKIMSTLFFVSFFTLNVYAASKWVCTTEDRDREVLNWLKLPGYLSQNGVFTVPASKCGLPHVMIYQDACTVGHYHLTIGLEGAPSVLANENTTRFFRLNCAKASTQEVGQQQQAPDSHDNPSHGGGN